MKILPTGKKTVHNYVFSKHKWTNMLKSKSHHKN